MYAAGLVVEDHAADALTETGHGHNQLPIGAPGFLGLGHPQPANRLLQVGLLSSIASNPLSPATSTLAVSMRSCAFIWEPAYVQGWCCSMGYNPTVD